MYVLSYIYRERDKETETEGYDVQLFGHHHKPGHWRYCFPHIVIMKAGKVFTIQAQTFTCRIGKSTRVDTAFFPYQ